MSLAGNSACYLIVGNVSGCCKREVTDIFLTYTLIDEVTGTIVHYKYVNRNLEERGLHFLVV